MIFNKNVYSPSHFLSSFVKRMKLVTFLRTNSDIDYVENMRGIPFAKTKLDGMSLRDLNDLCHVRAFEENKGTISVDISRCNSCGDCSSFGGASIVLKELSRTELGSISLDLNRDE
jgi:ferredoxin-like protein FixX